MTADNNSPLVSLIIVNYNAGKLLNSCLESVSKQDFPNWEVIIIDNASQDNSLESISPKKRIKVIRNEDNIGFAAGQNQGFKLAKGKYLMTLNFDIVMTSSFLGEMIKAINLDDWTGSATCKLLYMKEDGSITNQIYSAGHVLPPNRFPILRGETEYDHGQYDQSEFVFGAPGAAALYRRECLQDVAYQGQFFDESYFMWCEDVDLDWRIKLRGWKCIYTPKAVAYHIGHPKGYDPLFKAFQAQHSIKNRWAMIIADESRENFLANLWPILKYEISLFIYVIRSGLFRSYLIAIKMLVINFSQIIAKRRYVRKRASAIASK